MATPAAARYRELIEEARRQACVVALQFTGGNVTRAARWLGINRQTLLKQMRRFDLRREAFKG